MGDLAKLDYKHIWSIEKGRGAPSFDAIGKLAKALRVEPFELFLPDRLASGAIEQRLRQSIVDFDRMEPSAIKAFFNDLATALRKLESKK